MNDLQDKVALVTGAASGIGRAVARMLCERGARVMLTDRDPAGAEVAAALGDAAAFMEQDVRDEARWTEVVDGSVARFGALHVLVNNAGTGVAKDLESTTLEEWRRVQAVNSESVFLGTKAALPHLAKAGRGSIINVSSVAGLVGDPMLAAYCASKGAVRLFTKAAALHCSARGYDVRCNSIHPGFVDTPMVQSMISGAQDPARMKKAVTRTSPMGRLGHPDEVAQTICFLASDASSFTNGAELIVDGGATAR